MALSVVVGSVAQLKSGGPVMTVTLIENGIATCVWRAAAAVDAHQTYADSGYVQRQFPLIALIGVASEIPAVP